MRSGTSSARAELPLTTPLIECHAHVLPDEALARFPDGGHPRYVAAERRVLPRMLEAHDACGVTHALVSDSFYMASAAAALPAWSPADRARLYNDSLAARRGILVGNDRPPVWFPLAESLALLDQLARPAADRDAVRWRNATQLFGLEPARVGA